MVDLVVDFDINICPYINLRAKNTQTICAPTQTTRTQQHISTASTMADSKFLNEAICQGYGLEQFLAQRFPGDNRFAKIKPKQDMPHQGYFPAGLICEAFGKQFKYWNKELKRSAQFPVIVRRLRGQGKKCLFSPRFVE